MTRNNLGQHLSWLLSRGSFIPVPITISESRSAVSNNDDHDDILTSDHIHKVEDDGDILFADTDMAKLHFNPQSSKKLRMHSMKNGVPSSSSTPSTRTSVEKAIENSTKASERASPRHGRQKTPGRRSPLGIDSPFSDIESVDLTGNPELATSSSGTVEAFGEPCRLWREDFALRAEPTPKRGKKRNSDEYRLDLVSPVGDIPVLFDSSSTLNKRVIRNNDGGEQSGKISQESPKRESSTQLAQDVISGTSTKKKPICQVIADSDDEHTADLEAHEGFDKPALVLGNDNLYPSLLKLAEDTNGITRDSPVKVTKSSPKKTPRRLSNQSSQKSLIKSPKTRPQVEGLLTSLAPYPSSSRNFAEQAKSAESSPAPTPATTQKVRDDRVVKFLALPDNVFEGVVAKLLQERKANAEVVYQHAIEGEIAPAHLITQNRNLGVRINAFKDLESERDAYRKTFIRKEELKRLVIQAIEQGDGLDTIPEVVKESQSAEKQLRDTETRILDQLIIAKPSFIDEGSFDNQIEREIKPPAEYSAILEPTAVSSVRQSSPARALSRTCSPRKLPFPTTIDTNIQRSSEVPAQTFEQRSILTAGDSAPFAGSMDPLLSDPNDTDEFGIDDDDDDFIEAADNRRFDQENYYNGNRKILAETSGNVSHAAAASQKYLTSEQAAVMCHPWSKDVKTVMKERFRLRGFRSNQLEAINATLSGKDAFVLMPTGGGKSLCYQLPAIVRSGRTKGVTLVVSPLLSLMQDQVAHLQDLHIKAFLINGEVSAQQKRWVTQTLASRDNDEIEILYITPEMINLNQTLRNSLESLHKNGNLARIVIDEAHCVSQWGHDFRPDYKELGTVRSRFPGVPVMALTATATQNVRVDVIHNLGMKGCEVFTQSFNRPNLTYEVLPKKGSMKEVTQRIVSIIRKSYQNKMGIVYCLSRNDCEKVSSHLCEFGVASKHYHAGMKPDERTQVQQQWQAGDFQVIVATIAFGMGIDKPDVRFVMHFSIPKSLEGYYQETGRAGRDGKRSGCYLFYGYRDSAVQKRLLESGDGSWAQKERQRQMLRNVVQFCENRTDCRRVQVLAYFNESFRREDCHRTCDNCKSDASFELQDFTSYAKRAIELVGDFEDRGEKTTLLHCVDIFAGHSKKSFPPEHKAHRLFGVGRGLELGEVERLFFRLLMEEALYEETKMFKSFATNYIKKGRKAEEYLHGRRSMQLPIRMSPNGKKRSNPSSRTGVYAAIEDHPQSTLLSSPIQSASRRKQARRKVDKMKEVQISSDDEDSDGFERLRIAGKPTRRKTNAPGPPIIGDHVMEELDDLHLIVVEDFMTHATAECNEIMMSKSLRAQPFTNSVLRQMAIQFPKNTAQLAKIKGIEAEKVDLYGDQFLRLIQSSKQLYEDMKRQETERANGGVVEDPNHKTVIELDSSDGYSSAEEIFNEHLDLSQVDDVRSRFFHDSPMGSQEVSSMANRLSTQLTDLDAYPVSPSGSSKPSRGRRVRSGSIKRTWRRKASGTASSSRRKVSGSRARSSGSSGDTTRAKSTGMARKAANTRPPAARKGTSQPRIGMMPT